MKTSIITVIVLSASVFSCAPKKSGVTARTGSATGSGLTNPGNINNPNCSVNSSATGMVFDNSSSGTNFESRVKDFLSATINPNEVGQINSNPNSGTGVQFVGTVKLDASGNVVSAGSKLYFTIVDSYAAQGGYDSYGNLFKPITVKFDQNTGAQFSGQFNKQNGTGTVTIRDNYGTAQLNGSYNAQTFSGTISFQNTQHILGSTPAQGILGQFQVAGCGFIQ